MNDASNFTPFDDVSRFPLSTFDDHCAPEGAAPTTRYADGIVAESERDPWLFWAVVIGCIAGMVLSVMWPMGVLS
jgi:hypothetical protein